MKILVLTSCYPEPEDDSKVGATPVVHYFAREWVKSGHEVLVIHNANKFILPLYLLPSFIKRKINSMVDMVFPKLSQRKALYREMEGVKIKRIPILKVIPRCEFLPIQIKLQLRRIQKTLLEQDFIPDVMVGHWETPQIPLLSMLKEVYSCKAVEVFHGTHYIHKGIYYKKYRKYLESIDQFGGRSPEIARKVKESLKLQYDPFICYSGIPNEYIREYTRERPEKRFEEMDAIHDFLYVGKLIDRKCVDSIILALRDAYPMKNFHLNIIGVGACEASLRDMVDKFGLQEQITFYGSLPREEVIKHMQYAQCFTMISSREVFGLVYLEAMSQGCIVIASRNEGFDGIIVDGLNGFLCEAGNAQELSKVYERINGLTQEEKEQISRNAVETAHHFTDSEVAKRYLKVFY